MADWADRHARINEVVLSDPAHWLGRIGAQLSCKNPFALHHCPFHHDNDPSFSVFMGHDGKLRWKCYGACADKGDFVDAWQRAWELPGPAEAVKDLELTMGISGPEKDIERARQRRERRDPGYTPKPTARGKGSKFPEGARLTHYVYEDDDGNPLFEVVRGDWEDEDGRHRKGFTQRRPDGNGGWIPGLEGVRRVPYHLPLWLDGDAVALVEGEKDVATMERLGFRATCIPGGAQGWKEEFAYEEWFDGQQVLIIPDRDRPGDEFTDVAGRALSEWAEGVKVLRLPLEWRETHGPDITDWVAEGHTRRDLAVLIKELAEPWGPLPEEPAPEPEPEPPEEEGRDLLRSVETILHAGGPANIILARARDRIDEALAELHREEEGPLWQPWSELRTPEDDHAYVKQGPLTGYFSLDQCLFGLRPGTWVTVEGDSGLGKSTFINSIVHATAEQGAPWLVITIEDSPEAWWCWMLARASQVNGYHIATGDYPEPAVQTRVQSYAGQVGAVLPLISYPPKKFFPMTIDRMKTIVTAYLAEVEGGRVVVDPAHQVGGRGETHDREEEICDFLLDMAHKHQTTIITSTHLNKAKQVKGSTKFQFGADIRLGLSIGKRAERLNEEVKPSERTRRLYLDCRIEKNKGMPTRMIPMVYNRETCTFKEIGGKRDERQSEEGEGEGGRRDLD